MTSRIRDRSEPSGGSTSVRLGGGYRSFLAGSTVSYIGTGLVFPLSTIYIATRLHLGAGAAAAYFGVLAAVTAISALPAGKFSDTVGPRLCQAGGSVLQAAGYGLLGLAHDLAAVLSSAVIVGVGFSLTQAAFPVVVASLVPLPQRRRAFAVRYLAMNAGLGVGAAIGGIIVASVASATVFRELYLADSASFVPLVLIVYAVVPESSRSTAREAGRPPGYWNLVRSPVVVLLVSVSALIGLFGYTQFEASVPLLVHTRMGLSAGIVGGIVTLNTLAVITAQQPVTRYLERYSESAVLMLAPVCFAVAFCFGLVAAILHGLPRIVVLAGFPVVFALGEAAYSSSFHPLMVKISPGDSLGQVSGLCGFVSGVSAVAGPAFGIVLIANVPPLVSWAGLAMAVLIAFALAALLHRVVARTPLSGTSHSSGAVTTASGGAT